MISVRAVRAGEAAALRDVRLRAMADAPHAFGGTLADEQARSEEHWAALAAGDDEVAVYVAVDGEQWIGMGAGQWFDRELAIAQLWGMWVDPRWRGQQAGERIVTAIRGWAVDQGARFLRLGLIEGSAAQRFYERLGFVVTGETKPLIRDPGVIAVYMVRPA